MYNRLELIELEEKVAEIAESNRKCDSVLAQRVGKMNKSSSVLLLRHDCGVKLIDSPLWDIDIPRSS